MKRPNILFAFADDWGRYASAYAAHQGERSLCALIDTPHFDRVAGEGVLFTNALVPAPSCTPCRSSILSGRYFWQTGLGAILLGAVWDRAIPSYPFLLRDAGYHIGFSYKVWSPGTPQDDPYGGTETRYQDCGDDFNRFSFRAAEWAGEAGGVEHAKRRLCDEARGNFRSFLADRNPEQPYRHPLPWRRLGDGHPVAGAIAGSRVRSGAQRLVHGRWPPSRQRSICPSAEHGPELAAKDLTDVVELLRADQGRAEAILAEAPRAVAPVLRRQATASL